MLVTSVRFKKRIGGITKNPIIISKIPMISKLKPKFGGTKKKFHIHQISLIEIPFHWEQVFNVVASTEICVILRLSLPSVTRENLRRRISVRLFVKPIISHSFPKLSPTFTKRGRKISLTPPNTYPEWEKATVGLYTALIQSLFFCFFKVELTPWIFIGLRVI